MQHRVKCDTFTSSINFGWGLFFALHFFLSPTSHCTIKKADRWQCNTTPLGVVPHVTTTHDSYVGQFRQPRAARATLKILRRETASVYWEILIRFEFLPCRDCWLHVTLPYAIYFRACLLWLESSVIIVPRTCVSGKAFFLLCSLRGFLVPVIPRPTLHVIDLLFGSRKLCQKSLAHDLPGCHAELLSGRQNFLLLHNLRRMWAYFGQKMTTCFKAGRRQPHWRPGRPHREPSDHEGMPRTLFFRAKSNRQGAFCFAETFLVSGNFRFVDALICCWNVDTAKSRFPRGSSRLHAKLRKGLEKIGTIRPWVLKSSILNNNPEPVTAPSNLRN